MGAAETETRLLLAAARGGDSRALDALYARHRGRLLAFVRARMHSALARRVAPEDVLQETLLESARKIDAFEPQEPASFYRWLVQIARFKISEADRAWRARKRALETPLEEEPPRAQTSPSGRAVRAERAALLHAALEALPEAQAEAIRLRYLEGQSLAETAERLGRTEAAVKALVSRGFAALSDGLPGER